MIEEFLIDKADVDLSQCKIYLYERYDIAGFLFFNDCNKIWEFEKDFDTTEDSYDCMKMIKNDEELSELLDFLPKDHQYYTIFQLPDEHFADIYPHVEEGKVCVKIIAEFLKDKLIEPSFNMDKNMLELTDLNSGKQLDNALKNLDCISTSLDGIAIYDYKNGYTYEFIAPSAVYRDDILFNSDHGSIFEIIKMTQAGIFKDMYPQFTDEFNYVQNIVLKTVFDYLMTAMKVGVDTSEHIGKIRNIGEYILEWFMVALVALPDSKQSESVVLWRKLIELDIDYDHILSAYEALK